MWSSIVDALLPRLRPRGSGLILNGKLAWFESVTEVDLTECWENSVSDMLAELESMPSLRSLSLRASCGESAVDAEAVCGLTTLTSLRFYAERVEDGDPVFGVWKLDLSRLTSSLTSLDLGWCWAVTDKQVLELSNLTGLTDLSLEWCINTTRLRALSSLTALTSLDVSWCDPTDEDLQALSSLTALSTLCLYGCNKVTAEAKQALRTAIPNLTIKAW
jgi:internalin A